MDDPFNVFKGKFAAKATTERSVDLSHQTIFGDRITKMNSCNS
jgi:hypothetical protein